MFEDIIPLPAVCRQSSMACAKHCERKWWYLYRLGVTLRGEPYKESATLGSIYHLFQKFGPDKMGDVNQIVRKKQAALIQRVDAGEDLDGSLSRLATSLTFLYHKAKVMAEIFWEKFPEPEKFKTVGREIEHRVGVDGLVVEGTIDKLLRVDNDIWIRDHKSTGRSLESIFAGVSWSLQARIYRLLADGWISVKENDLTGCKVKGFILDGVRTPGIKMCRTDDKNAKEWGCTKETSYLRRVKDWYDAQDEVAMRSRGIVFTESLMSGELGGAFLLMKRLFDRPWNVAMGFSRDSTRRECFAYEKECIYHDLCETHPDQWGGLFERKYKFIERDDTGNPIREDL